MKAKWMLPIVFTSVLILGACGGSKEKSKSSPDYELENVSFPLKEKVSLKMMSQSAPLAPNDPNDKLIFQRLEEETNLHIDWTNYSSDFAEKEIWISLVVIYQMPSSTPLQVTMIY